MKTKRVNRYYCDFCKYASGAAWATKRHERGCTLNPERVCRVCYCLEEAQAPLADLVAMFPNPDKYVHVDEWGGRSFETALTDEANKALEAVREAANNCPACILAAIRQARIPVGEVTDFNYTEETKAMWQIVNDGQVGH